MNNNWQQQQINNNNNNKRTKCDSTCTHNTIQPVVVVLVVVIITIVEVIVVLTEHKNKKWTCLNKLSLSLSLWSDLIYRQIFTTFDNDMTLNTYTQKDERTYIYINKYKHITCIHLLCVWSCIYIYSHLQSLFTLKKKSLK